MLTKTEKIHSIVRTIILALLIILFVTLFVPFSIPILMACFVALGCEPLIKKINFKTKERKYFTLGLFFFLLVVFLVPLVLFVFRIANGLKTLTAETMQNSQFVKALLDLWERVTHVTASMVNTFGLEQNIIPPKEELFTRASPFIMDHATTFLSSLPDILLSLFVFFCILFVMITNAKNLKSMSVNSNVLPAPELDSILHAFQNSCYTILVSTFLIGALQAFIVAVGSSIFGFHEFFLIFVVTFFASFIPVLGAGPVAVLLAVIAFLLGNTGDGIGLSVVAVVAGTIDNIIKPFVFSKDEEGLHPVVSLLGIIGAIIVFGLPGLLLGPFLLQVTIKLAPQLAEKIMKTFNPHPAIDS
jgi:predicted PurR-regulated permease PerM